MALPTLGNGSLSWRLIGFFLLSWLGSLLLFRAVLGARLEQSQVQESANILAHNIGLSELALERYPPEAVSKLNGYRLVVTNDPTTTSGPQRTNPDPQLGRQQDLLRSLLCQRLGHCPELRAERQPERGLWIRLASPLEPVWLFFPLPTARLLSRDPLLLSLSLITGSVMAGGLFLVVEVRRPIRRLVKAMAQVNSGSDGQPAPAQGAQEVRQLSEQFNAMLVRLQDSERERQTMLAGIAHDLNAPLTRMRLRLGDSGELGSPAKPLLLDPTSQTKLSADLDSLGRITQQFLLYAGSLNREPFVVVPLDSLLQELCARYDDAALTLDLESLEASVQPIALGRAISNLIDNALDYGEPPLELRLRAQGGDRYVVEVRDHGPGIPQTSLARALEPFQRLDRARRGEGHCGLGLAIVERTAKTHAGQLLLETIPASQGGGLRARFIARRYPQ
jgi:two-component system osmolarity sensor histidine kinase EnvZ